MSKNLYKVISVTDREGNIKQDAINEMREICDSLVGEILYPEFVKEDYRLCLAWNNDSGRMMRTSLIESVDKENGYMKIVTRNSIYELEEVTNE